MKDDIVLYTYPLSRGTAALWTLEEIGVPYRVEMVRLSKNEQKSPAYLAINPMGKVPALIHRGVVITEAAAICAYLADAFPQAHLAPKMDDPQRGVYFRWLFFSVACIEAAVLDNMAPRTNPPNVKMPRPDELGHGTFADVVNALDKALQPGPFILGDRFSAADIYVGGRISYNITMGRMERTPRFGQYIDRLTSRPAFQRVIAKASAMLKDLELPPYSYFEEHKKPDAAASNQSS